MNIIYVFMYLFILYLKVFEVKRQMRSTSDPGSRPTSGAYYNGSVVPSSLDRERSENAVVV